MEKNVLATDLTGKVAVVTGAGGSNLRAQTEKEYCEPGDLDAETRSFFVSAK